MEEGDVVVDVLWGRRGAALVADNVRVFPVCGCTVGVLVGVLWGRGACARISLESRARGVRYLREQWWLPWWRTMCRWVRGAFLQTRCAGGYVGGCVCFEEGHAHYFHSRPL
eukprot:scaffold3988_cov21-Tisochrysis_lutea.AAC.1